MLNDYVVSVKDYVQVLEARRPSRVLITVPHDGLSGFQLESFLPKRKKGVHAHDCGVWPIVRDMLGVCGANVIRGLLPREYVDYNRPESEAFDAVQFRDAYQAYHGRVFHMLHQMQQRFGTDAILLIDMHGFTRQPPLAPRDGYDLVFETRNRQTVVHGQPDRAYADALSSCGYEVLLPQEQVQHLPHDPLNGGFTVRSCSRELRVNAIQIEIASRFRHRHAAMLGTRLSENLATFLRDYYPI